MAISMADARSIRGERDWGMQGGLLSVAEIAYLANLVAKSTYNKFLELSTRVIGGTLGWYSDWATFVSVDNHKGDSRVPVPAGVEKFLGNAGAYCTPLFIDSQALVAPLMFEFVFYDGDHEAEQMRFTQAVHESPMVELFVFDDRDFPVPAECCEWLRAKGWRDMSPPCQRLHGDKENEQTMTLGVFTR